MRKFLFILLCTITLFQGVNGTNLFFLAKTVVQTSEVIPKQEAGISEKTEIAEVESSVEASKEEQIKAAATKEVLTPKANAISYQVSSALSTDGKIPDALAFGNSTTVDMTSIIRYEMFYTYIKIAYDNESGVPMAAPVVQMQLPKTNDPTFFESLTPSNSPGNWVAYPNTPSGAGNNDFPTDASHFSVNNGTLTWKGNDVQTGSYGEIYIKIPMRMPYTNLGTFNYNVDINYSLNSSIISESYTTPVTLSGNVDEPTYSISQSKTLSYVPSEPDATNYWYAQYYVNTNYTSGYQMPPRAWENQQALAPSPQFKWELPADAEVMSSSGGYLGNGQTYVVRYPKTKYPTGTEKVTLTTSLSGRYAAQTTQAVLPNYTQTFSSAVGSTNVPANGMGGLGFTFAKTSYSAESMKLGSVEIRPFYNAVFRNATPATDSDLFIYENGPFKWVKNGVESDVDYAISNLNLSADMGTVGIGSGKVAKATVYATYADGTTVKIVDGLTLKGKGDNQQIIKTTNTVNANGSALVKVRVEVTNASTQFNLADSSHGYVKSYPSEGADALRQYYYGDAQSTVGGELIHASNYGQRSIDNPVVTETKIAPKFTFQRTTTSLVAPGGTDVLNISSRFDDMSKQAIVNPTFYVLLPAGYSYSDFKDKKTENFYGSVMPDGQLTSAAVTEQSNYSGTGRTLIRIQYKGLLQKSEQIGGQLTIVAPPTAQTGDYQVDAWLNGANENFSNILDDINAPIVQDKYDVNGNESVSDNLFGLTITTPVQRGIGALVYGQVKGNLDQNYASTGTTKVGSIAQGTLNLEYNGLKPLSKIVLVGQVPNESDGKTKYGSKLDGQRAIINTPLDLSDYPGAVAYYNINPTVDPNANGWTTTFGTGVVSVKVVMPSTISMVSAGLEKISIPVDIKVPAPISSLDVVNVTGKGSFQSKAYAQNLPTTGLVGIPSSINSIGLGIRTNIFNDLNKNGIKDSNETFVSGQIVKLVDLITNKVVHTAISDDSGIVDFATGINGVDLNVQKYQIVVVADQKTTSFTSGIGDVTTDAAGTQSIYLTQAEQIEIVNAGLQIKEFNLTFDVTTNGGNGSTPTSQTIPFGELAIAPITPTKFGATFIGWNTKADGTGSEWDFSTTTMPSQDVTLYAIWQINNQNLSFNVNGGETPVPDSQVIKVGELATNVNEPTRTNYTFNEWNTKADGSGETWDFTSSKMPAVDTTLYAIWTAKKFEVSFDGNGGTTPTPVTSIVPFEELIKVPTAPTRTGYAFVGWNTSTDGKGKSWDFSTMPMPAKNFTLYAIWQGNKQNLNFDVNGGTTPAPVKQVVFVGQLATQVSNPTRTGYTFIEWNTKIDGTGEAWNFATSKIGTTDTTLYAQWIPEKKQVTFEMNGGDIPSPQVQSVEVNAQITSPSNPTKTGNLFVGWNTKSDGTGKTWDFSTDLMPATDLSLYAIWNPKKLNLSFDVNGGEMSSPVSQVIEYGQKASPVTNPTKTGYTFNGWNSKVDQSGTMWDFNSSTMPATDLTLYATWTPIKTAVNFDVNGASSPNPPETQVDPGTTVNEPVDPVRAGFRFVGWNTELDGSGITWNFATTEVETTPVKLYAQWQPDIYNLVFNVNGASTKTPVGQEIPFGELATKVTDPVRAGYVFKEWNTKIDGSGDTWDFSLNTMPATEVTLYAKWTPAKYELSFDTAGGNTPPVSQTLEVQKFATSVKAPTKVGSSFIGWNTKLDGSGRSWNFTTTKMPAQDTKLFAQWETLKYNLSFNVNGGETATPATQTIAFENLATAVNTPTRTGFTFKEWNTKLDGTGKKWNFSSTKMQAFDQELYAVWTPNEIELSFDPQGGTPTPISQTLPVLSLATKPVEPTKAGHTFTGWNTELDGTGKSWNFSSSKMEFTSVKLFAIWTPKSYNVTFDPSGATAIDIPPQTVEFEKLIDEPTKLVRTGYIFKEWQTATGIKWDFKSSKMPASDLKLTAIWTPIEYQLTFDGNSSQDSIPTQSVAFEQIAAEPKVPKNIGYSFTGWNTVKDGSGTTWNFTSSKMPAKDLVLYAQWQPNNYNLTFNLAGGDKPQPELQSIPFNSLSTEPKEPIKVGYTFKEWQTPTGTKWVFATNKMPGNNLQLTAVWIPNKYKLSFDITSGSGTPPPVQAVEYTKLATKPADPIKVGYSFVGWNTEFDGSGSYWNFNTTKMNSNDQKLYAQYIPKQYLVTFVNKTPYTIKYLKYIGEQIEQPKDPNVTGYIFKGWFDQEVGGQKLDITTFKMPAKDLTIYAQYEKINYNVIFNDRGKEIKQVVPFDELVKEPVVPTKIGFTFTGWKTKIDGTEKTWDFAKDKMPANDLTLYSTFEPTKYKLKFISKNGTIEKTMKYNETITPPNPEIKGQRFIGWFTTKTGGEKWDFTKAKMPAGNLTLYAQYEETKPAIAKTGTLSVSSFALLIFICIVSGLFMARRFISSKS